ncbi:MAG: type I glyceraldehyde-3-phosphate dehydrogenase [Candidatus Diapherotrites archaeon]
MKVAINGFGRIGRLFLRHALSEKSINVVAVNDLGDAKTMAHLFKYDSVFGKFPGEVKAGDGEISINGKKIKVFSERDPEKLPWASLGVEIVLESTGVFTKKEDCSKHLKAGAKRVVLSAPPKSDDIKQFVLGVNEKNYDPKTDFIVSNASCTTNSLAPVAKILNDEFGIEKGFMTTIHAYTGDQVLVDGPHKDLRRARAAATNIVPTTTGAAKAISRVIPELAGKLDGIAVRVPVPCGSVTDFVAWLEREVTVEQVNAAVKKAAEGSMKGILEFSTEELVSSDIVANPHSSIFDSKCTMASGKMVKVLCWYDNEFGYSKRLVDLMKFMEAKK